MAPEDGRCSEVWRNVVVIVVSLLERPHLKESSGMLDRADALEAANHHMGIPPWLQDTTRPERPSISRIPSSVANKPPTIVFATPQELG